MIMLFMTGIVEMLIVTIWTETVTKSMVLASGVITLLNVAIWYFVLQNIVENINNLNLITAYAFGCALGTVAATAYSKYKKDRKVTESNIENND